MDQLGNRLFLWFKPVNNAQSVETWRDLNAVKTRRAASLQNTAQSVETRRDLNAVETRRAASLQNIAQSVETRNDMNAVKTRRAASLLVIFHHPLYIVAIAVNHQNVIFFYSGVGSNYFTGFDDGAVYAQFIQFWNLF